MALAGLVYGILSLPMLGLPGVFGILYCILALVRGTPEGVKSQRIKIIVGLILSIVGIAFWTTLIIIYFVQHGE